MDMHARLGMLRGFGIDQYFRIRECLQKKERVLLNCGAESQLLLEARADDRFTSKEACK
jgi:hypothetical protein